VIVPMTQQARDSTVWHPVRSADQERRVSNGGPGGPLGRAAVA